MPTAQEIVALVKATRFPLSDEKRTQVGIADLFTNNGINFKREARLSDADIVDFMVEGGIAIEAKIKGQKRAIFRQLERYAAHECVREIILVTSVAMQLPPTINNKPASVASLSQGWL